MMIICPYCNGENIEGADSCEHCLQPLSDQHLPVPATLVERSLLRDRMQVLAPKQPIVVAPDCPVRKVLRLLVDQRIGCVLVGEQGRVVGIFSERDALRKLNVDASRLAERPISEFMTADPETLDDRAKIAFAVQRMDLGGYRHVPLINAEGRATGIVSVRDILRYLTERMTASAE